MEAGKEKGKRGQRREGEIEGRKGKGREEKGREGVHSTFLLVTPFPSDAFLPLCKQWQVCCPITCVERGKERGKEGKIRDGIREN